MLKLPHNWTHLTASKVMLKILQARLQEYMNHKLPDFQYFFFNFFILFFRKYVKFIHPLMDFFFIYFY